MKLKLIELQEEINESTIIVGNFNTPFSIIDGHKINKKDNRLNTINQFDLINIYKTLHSTINIFTKTFTRIDSICYKASLNTFKRTQVI